MRHIPRPDILATLLTTCLAVGLATPASAQGEAPINAGTASSRLGYMPAGDHSVVTAEDLRAYRNVPARRIPRLGVMKKVQAESEAARLAAGSNASSSEGTLVAPVAAAGPSPQAISGSTCTTNSTVGFAPSDIHGAVGLSNQVVVTNVEIGIFNRSTCALSSKVTLKSFFGVTNANETLFDPRVVYDKRTNRFFVTVESRVTASNDQRQYFAVSTNSTGLAWWKYTISLSSGTSAFCKSAASSFWDYPSVGLNRWRWFITANDFGASTTGSILMIDKLPTLSGGSTALWCWGGRTFNIAPPIVLDNSTTATFLSPGSGSGSAVTRYDIVVNTSTNGSGDLLFNRPSYPITAWSASTGGWQPNAGFQKLDGLDGRFQSSSIQSLGRIWNVHTVDVGSFARARFYRFYNTSTSSSPAPTFVFTPFTATNDDIINPSVSTGSGLTNAPMFASATRTRFNDSATGKATMIVFSGLNGTTNSAYWRYDTIYVSPSTFQTTDGVTACNASSRGSCRWGDYSSTQVDPAALGRAWAWNQVIPGPGTTQFDWSTRSGQVEVNLPYGPSEVANAE